MPDTLMLAFQRPSDDEIELLSILPISFKELSFKACRIIGGMVRQGLCTQIGAGGIVERTPFGTLVLAACDTDAPDPVGRVVDAARLVRHNYHRSECCIDPRIMDVLIQRLNELDRATGKAGEVG